MIKRTNIVKLLKIIVLIIVKRDKSKFSGTARKILISGTIPPKSGRLATLIDIIIYNETSTHHNNTPIHNSHNQTIKNREDGYGRI